MSAYFALIFKVPTLMELEPSGIHTSVCLSVCISDNTEQLICWDKSPYKLKSETFILYLIFAWSVLYNNLRETFTTTTNKKNLGHLPNLR